MEAEGLASKRRRHRDDEHEHEDEDDDRDRKVHGRSDCCEGGSRRSLVVGIILVLWLMPLAFYLTSRVLSAFQSEEPQQQQQQQFEAHVKRLEQLLDSVQAATQTQTRELSSVSARLLELSQAASRAAVAANAAVLAMNDTLANTGVAIAQTGAAAEALRSYALALTASAAMASTAQAQAQGRAAPLALPAPTPSPPPAPVAPSTAAAPSSTGSTTTTSSSSSASSSPAGSSSDTDVQRQKRFTEIYEKNFWGGAESRSGPGSSVGYTTAARDLLERIFSKYSIATMLDAPCGDFNWVHQTSGFRRLQLYTGVDIVPEMIAADRKRAESLGLANAEFAVRDIVREGPGRAYDLVMTRHALMHLPYDEAVQAVRHIEASGSKYFLTTTYNSQRNDKIVHGDFYHINVELPPFNFGPPLEIVQEPGGTSFTMFLALYRLPVLNTKHTAQPAPAPAEGSSSPLRNDPWGATAAAAAAAPPASSFPPPPPSPPPRPQAPPQEMPPPAYVRPPRPDAVLVPGTTPLPLGTHTS